MKSHTQKSVVLISAMAVLLGFAAAELQKNVRSVASSGTPKGLPDVAYDAQAERYLVVWQERDNAGDDRDVRARVLNRDGSPASAVIALASSGQDERFPKVAASGASSWTVVWSTGAAIEACSVDVTGKAGGFRTVTSDLSPLVDRPDIGACSPNAFLVVWEEIGASGLSVIKARHIGAASAGADGDEFIIADSPMAALGHPSVNQSGDGSFVAWDKAVEARRTDIEGRMVPAGASSGEVLGGIVPIAADGAQNTLPSVAAYSATDAYLVVWQRSDSRRASDIAFAHVTGSEVQGSGKLTETVDLREMRPSVSSIGIAGRALVTYQYAPAAKPRLREIAARTIGWGDLAASAEIALDPTRAGGGNPAAVIAAGADGRGLVAWDVREGEGTDLYAKEWLAAELGAGAAALDGPIVPLADVFISGTVTFNGLPQADVLMSGFPLETRTNAAGAYSGAVPAPWSGTITPAQPGFTFSPASRTYTDVAVDMTGENYIAAFVGGVDDIYEDNEDFASAATLPIGTTHDLVLNDADWFKFQVTAEDAGKDLRVRLWGTGFPNTTVRRDLDFAILDSSGKLLSYSISGSPDELAYICGVTEGWYYVAHNYVGIIGTVYSLTVELSDAFGIGYVTGHVYDDYDMPVEGATVELYSLLFDWNVTRPLAVTDAEGYYRIGWGPGDYTLRFNVTDFGNDGLDWTPDQNYLGEMYNWGEVVTLSSGLSVENKDGYLTPGGTISGRITDAMGAPISSARANINSSDTLGAGSTTTDGDGNYTIDRIRAGNFAVQLLTPGGAAVINEWYDDQIGFSSADPVGIEAGLTASGISGQLQEREWGSIQGRVTDANGNPVYNMNVGLLDPTANFGPWSVKTDSNGYYSHTRVPAGSWKVFFNAGSIASPNLVPQYYPGTRLVSAATPVQVNAGQTTSGIDAVLELAGTISGQVLNNNNYGGVNVVAFDTSDPDFSRGISPNIPVIGAPTYTIRNLRPGTYKVLARPSTQGDRIPHWYPDAASYAAAGSVTVTAGATTSGIDITLASGGGSITGRVVDTSGGGIAGVAVIVQDATRLLNYSSCPSNDDGYYTVRQIPAGSAKVYFNTEANWINFVSEYYNNKTTYGSADAVTVTEGGTLTLSNAVLNYRSALAIGTTSLPAGEVAVPYRQQLVATGGRPFYRWTITSGQLPDGLSMGSNGSITGVPITAGTFDFIVSVTDSTLPLPYGEIRYLSITVGAYTGEGFAISGTVTEGGLPLAGVTIDGLPGSPVTSASGTYIVVVEKGFWGTLTPVRTGYAFDPPFRTYTVVAENITGQDYAASPGVLLSGTVRLGGAAHAGVLMTGLPVAMRTDSQGYYSMMLPVNWTGTITPFLPGFTFSPPSRTYSAGLVADTPLQDFTSTYAGGADDEFEDNDTFDTAAVIPIGSEYPDLVLNDQDWFKFEVLPGDAGKVLGVRLQATSFPDGGAYPDPNAGHDLDFGIMDSTGKLLTYNMSGAVDEVAFIPNIAPGWYSIAHTYLVNPGMVYSLYVTVSDVLPVGTVSGRITNEEEQGVEGVTVELYKVPFDWFEGHQMAITDADGNYKIAAFAGDYQIRAGIEDFNQNPTDGLPDGWLPVSNYLGNSYDYDKTVAIAPGAPVTGADVRLEWSGAISGRVTDGGGNPVNLVRVTAHLAGGAQAGFAYTDADGNYTMRHLRSANYAVFFRPPVGSALAREWNNDLTTLAEILPVAVTAQYETTGIDAVLETGGQISGHVTNETGDPVQGVTVAALDASGVGMQSTTTQADGGYLLNSLRAGTFDIIFNTSTCTSGNYLTSGYSGGPVAVAVGQTTSGIDKVLYAAGAIEGRLTDGDGRGLMGGSVHAISNATGDFWSATLDHEGNYVIRNLPPGDYRVRFAYNYGSITNYPPKWYPGVNSGTDATLVPVTAGESASGIDGVLADDGGGISGRVTNLYGGGIAGIVVQAQDGSFGESVTSPALTDADGYYTIRNVPAGTAKVYFRPGFMPFSPEFYNDKASYGSADSVTIDQSVITPSVNAALAVRPSLEMVTTSLPPGELGVAYEGSLEASGGFPFYHWSLYSGALPPGLEMNARGEISGMPTALGTFNFMITLTDSSISQQGWTSGLSITIGEYTGTGYTVSGTVTLGATPLAGVTMSGLPGSPVTNAAGGYVAIVPSGWGGTVTPTLAGYAFTPATRTYANVSADSAAQDYAAEAGYAISGTVTLDGTGLGGVVMAGLPGSPSTDAAGAYAASVPSGWDGTVTPTLPGFTFNPSEVPYTDVSADLPAQNYTANYAGGADDAYEDNDDFASAAVLPMGTTTRLVLHDEDWFKVYVPAEDVGKDLRVHIWGTAYPDPVTRKDLDFYVLNASGTAISLNLSGSPDETAYICNVAEGWYYIAHTYVGIDGTVYSVSVETNEDFGLGYVSGTVRDDDGDPIPGVSVELYGEPFNWDISRPLVYTDASGHYTIGYTPGHYTVQFNITNNSNAPAWEPDANFLAEAYNYGEVLTVAAGATLEAIDGQLTPGGSIAGRILDGTGSPLNLAAAFAYRGDGTYSGVLTNANGDYVIDRLRQGNYAVRFRAPGGVPQATEWYEDRNSFAAALPVAVAPGQAVQGINAMLGVPGAIAGHIENETGDPILGVQVTAYDPAGIALQSVNTDAAGNYYLGRLPTGSFKVLFNAATATSGNYVSEYYPDQRFIADAGTVGVTADSTTNGIDAVLAAGGTITGRVTDAGGNALAGVGVHAFDVASDLAVSATTDANGVYGISCLPAGSYKVRFRPTTGDWAVEWWGGKTSFTAADAVAVAAEATVTGIDAELAAECGSIAGRVTDGVGAGIPGVTVVAQDTARAAAYSSAVTNANGDYAINRLPTCQVKLYFNTDSAYLNYASEYYNDKADHASADPIQVTVGETTSGRNAVLAARPALTVTTESLPAGELGVAYTAALAGSGGRPLYRFDVWAGALPDGLAMNGRGEITGLPTFAGTYSFTARLTDSTWPQQTTTKELSITIGEYTGIGHTISGKVLFGGLPLAGVVLNGLPGPPTTNVWGEYVTVAPDGWSGTATPTLAGHTFTPLTRVYNSITTNLSGQDYEAFVARTISGRVTLNSAGLAGVLMSGLPGDPVTGGDGSYSGIVPNGWSGTVTPTLEGYTFTPPNTAYTGITADETNEDYVATVIIPASAKVDFNGDGQEDVLWRYYGAGGYIRAWFLGDFGQGSAVLSASGNSPSFDRTSGVPKGGSAARPAMKNARVMRAMPSSKDHNVARTPRDLMGGKAGSKGRARVVDPRQAGGKALASSAIGVADPRQAMADAGVAQPTDAPVELMATPAVLGGADIMPVGDLNWQIMGTGDFDGDTHVDLLWRNIANGQNVVWFMSGTDWKGSAELLPVGDMTWQIVGTGDFNKDSHVDILWRNSASGDNVVWYMDGAQWIGSALLLGVSDQAWKIVGTGDFNQDGNVDLLWRYEGAGGYNVVWYLENTTWTGSAELISVGDQAWQIMGTGDYNRDGNVDILWRYNGAGGYNVIWYMNGVSWSESGEILPVPDLTWRIVSR